SDHWRCVSMPKWARLSSKVTSRLQRFIKSLTICSAVWGGSVEKMALGGRLPSGSRVRSQRIGKGAHPERYHSAVALQISRVRSPCPYEGRVSLCQLVAGSGKAGFKRGRGWPTTPERLVVCVVR